MPDAYYALNYTGIIGWGLCLTANIQGEGTVVELKSGSTSGER